MRRLVTVSLFLYFIIFLYSCSSGRHCYSRKRGISPYDFGLATAKTGVERYNVLLKTHQAAVKAGVNVDYTGIDTIRLEIPEKPSRIPLTQFNDFNGCVFYITNTSKNCWLFSSINKETPVNVPKRLIDAGDFRTLDSLRHGTYLLLIEDENPWVDNRRGFDYGHQRKDILLIENGIAQNNVVMPYNNEYSSPKCSVIKQSTTPFVMKNLTIERDPNCTCLTHTANISGYNDVIISDVKVYTPPGKMVNDRGITINNCTNVTLENVRIDGTYSQIDHYGYGLSMNNIWNFKAKRLYGRGEWGIFGNNNINTALIEDSHINRFDIHCYGSSILFKGVLFSDLYNQFSSVFGDVSFEGCTFNSATPVLIESSYYTYVGFNIIMKDCVLNAIPGKNHIVKLSRLNEKTNTRYELAEKCFPNMTIKNMTVNLLNGVKDFVVFNCTSSGKRVSEIGYLSKIDVDGLTINSDGETPVEEVLLCNINLQTKNAVDCIMKGVTINQPNRGVATKAFQGKEVLLKANMPLKGGMVTMKNVKNLKQ